MEQAKEIISLEVRVQGDVHHLSPMNSMFVLQGGGQRVGKGSSAVEQIRHRDVI